MFSLYQIRLGVILAIILFITSFLIYFFAPAHIAPLFYLKRMEEKVVYAVIPSAPLKLEYDLYLLDRRLSEMKYLVKNNYDNCILSCSLRYSGILADTKDLLVKNNLKNKLNSTLDKFQNNKNELQNLVDNYPKDKNVEWKYIQDSINYTNIYTEELKSTFSSK